jgi:hypothetical protein
MLFMDDDAAVKIGNRASYYFEDAGVQGKTSNLLSFEAPTTVFKNLKQCNGKAIYSHTGRAGLLRKGIN